MKKSILLATASLSIALLPTFAEDWTGFRGSSGDSIVKDTGLPSEWSDKKNILWEVKVPGYAWSSPIVVGDKIFVSTAISEKQKKPQAFAMGGGGGGGNRPPRKEGETPPTKGENPPTKGGPPGKDGTPGKGGGFGMGNVKPPDDLYRWEMHCLDAKTGKTLWKTTAKEQKPLIATHSSNTFASETPVTDGKRVYAYFSAVGLFCFDAASGSIVWKKELGNAPLANGFGSGSSPLLAEGKLFVQYDNEEKSMLVALNPETGDEVWKQERDEKTSWSTPYLWKNKKRTELVAMGGKKILSYNPADGKVLWELKNGDRSSFSSSPAADEERMYFGTSGPMSNAPLWAINAGAEGDISLKEGEKANQHVAWAKTRSGPGMASPLVYQGLLYVVSRGIVNCYDGKTGEPIYDAQRLPNAKGVTSSPFIADGKLFILDEDGQCFIVQTGKEFKVLGKNKLDDGMFWSSPAISGKTLYIRGTEKLFCIGGS